MDTLDESIAALGRWVDEAFVGFSLRGRALDPAGRARAAARLTDAATFYRDESVRAALFAPPPPPDPVRRTVKRFAGGEVVDLRWPSAYTPVHAEYADALRAFPETTTCHARWYRHDAPRPTVLVLHGWGGGFYALDALVYRANWLFARDLDVVLLQAPFHAARARPDRLVPPVFPSYARPALTNEGFAQSVSDARAALRLVLAHGAPTVGAFGMSMGGFTAALLATAEPDLAFVVAAIPFATLPDLAWAPDAPDTDSVVASSLGVSRACFLAAFDAIDPLGRPPAVDGARVAIVYGTEDRVTPVAHAERLGRHFPGSELVPFPGAHLVQWRREIMFHTLAARATAPR